MIRCGWEVYEKGCFTSSITFFAPLRPNGAFFAIDVASDIACSLVSSGDSLTRLTILIEKASSPLVLRAGGGVSWIFLQFPYKNENQPVRIRSLATEGPTSLGNRTVPRQPGKSPSEVSGKHSIASRYATLKSQESASSSPQPNAAPWRAAMVGIGQAKKKKEDKQKKKTQNVFPSFIPFFVGLTSKSCHRVDRRMHVLLCFALGVG